MPVRELSELSWGYERLPENQVGVKNGALRFGRFEESQ